MARTTVCAMALAAVALIGCSVGPRPPVEGVWHAWLDSPGGPLPFRLELTAAPGATLVNGAERIEVERVVFDDDIVLLEIARYDATVSARLSSHGRRLDGHWSKTTDGRPAELPFHATAGAQPRFGPGADDPRAVAGRWRVRFESSEDPAVALLDSSDDGRLVGTFLTTTGDYRFLEGSLEGDRLRLSCFDGAHAFLFDARLEGDGSLSGDFWSRNSWHERWTARRDESAELPDGFGSTRWLGGDLASLAFPDLDGRMRSLDDAEFAGRARIIEVFGSWCPNCNDATRSLVELDRRYRDRGLSILGLAFELTGDFERDTAQLRRWADALDVEFPILLAGVADKEAASLSLPLIDQVRAYPTTVFLHRDGRVRAVHQGYSGPATGEAHARLSHRFVSIVEELLDEPD